jgi:hypothetical protein
VEIALGFTVEKATLCDMLENAEREMEVIDGKKLRVRLKPFEVATIRLEGVKKIKK